MSKSVKSEFPDNGVIERYHHLCPDHGTVFEQILMVVDDTIWPLGEKRERPIGIVCPRDCGKPTRVFLYSALEYVAYKVLHGSPLDEEQLAAACVEARNAGMMWAAEICARSDNSNNQQCARYIRHVAASERQDAAHARAMRAWEDWDDEEIEREFSDWPPEGV